MNHPTHPFYFEAAAAEGLTRLVDIDLAALAPALDIEWTVNALLIPFFGFPHRVSTDGITDASGKPPTPAVASLLLDYVLRCPAMAQTTDAWITFREFSGAGPLMGYFTNNTNKLIESHFSGDVCALESACSGLNGKFIRGVSGVDLCMELAVLPRVPLRIAFNDQDEDFAAQCSMLFQQSAESYLSMKSMAVAATWLAGKLMASHIR